MTNQVSKTTLQAKMNYTTCSLCKEQGHHTAKCPDLCEPLKPGFHSGGGGGGGHGGDDDDETLQAPLCLYPGFPAAAELLERTSTALKHRFSTNSNSSLLL